MATGGERGEEASSPWLSSLPPELLGLILQRVQSLTDRVRFSDVCRSWRSGSRLQPALPLPAPWLVLGDNAYLDLGNGAVHSLSVPGWAYSCLGSIGDWLFVSGGDDDDCWLVNPFSAAVLSLEDLASFLRQYQRVCHFSLCCRGDARKAITKMVAMAPLQISGSTPSNPRRSGPVVASLMKGGSNYENDTLFLFRVGSTSDPDAPRHLPWWLPMYRDIWFTDDIEFFRGKLYVLVLLYQLTVIELEAESSGSARPSFTGKKRTLISVAQLAAVEDTMCWRTESYLVVSGDRLLMVRRLIDAVGRSYKFEVFEADLSNGYDVPGRRWEEVGSLRGHAIFLSKQGSKSVPAAQYRGGGVVQEDCIYFIRDCYRRRSPGDDPLGDSGVYNLRDNTVAPLPVPETAVSRRTCGPGMPIWFFPTQVR